VAQLVECLPSKLKALSSNPIPHTQKNNSNKLALGLTAFL
jgi:hypothetical protein